MEPLDKVVNELWKSMLRSEGGEVPIIKKVGQGPPRPPQHVNGKPRPTAASDDPFADAVPISELADDWNRVVLYGENRVGKTTLACQWPKPLLLLAMEPNRTGGASSVKKVEGVVYMRVDSRVKALGIVEALVKGDYRSSKWPGRLQTVVIDSATSYQDVILKEILGVENMPEQLNWGEVSRDQYRVRSEKTREALRPFLNLDCHVVVTAKQRDHNPPDKEKPAMLRGFQAESFIAADLGGATVGWLHDACDCIFHMHAFRETKKVKRKLGGEDVVEEVETGRVVRRIRTLLHTNYAAGIRSCSPEKVPEFIVEPTWEKIKAVIDGE